METEGAKEYCLTFIKLIKYRPRTRNLIGKTETRSFRFNYGKIFRGENLRIFMS